VNSRIAGLKKVTNARDTFGREEKKKLELRMEDVNDYLCFITNTFPIQQ
jgi:hypothetical protein